MDYLIVFVGSATFKLARIVFVALLCVHYFACLFFRVKVIHADLSPSFTGNR
jgi:hypothetical protein